MFSGPGFERDFYSCAMGVVTPGIRRRLARAYGICNSCLRVVRKTCDDHSLFHPRR